MEEELIQYSERLGERLEKLILPLVEPGGVDPKDIERSERFRSGCLSLAERIWEMLDARRDLVDNRILVLENGTGYLARRLAEGDVDVVSAAPTRRLADLAKRLNPYPSIIYRCFNPYPATDNFDLIIGTGIIACYPKPIARLLIQSLTSFCRRKFITELPVQQPWLTKLFQGGITKDSPEADLELARFGRGEIFELVEHTCGLLISENRMQQGKMLFKALRKVHLQPWL
ncbi:MAG TPA: hypothetical protein VJ417_16975 [Candidatus Glassbacteria bacterium]|nr:hypothetical protein [Candidatus Glassbacteria bacterium]